MANIFRKESPRFDDTNYDIWKDQMKIHLLCMGLGYCLVTKTSKNIAKEDNLETYTEEQREVFMCNIRERKVILSTLPKSEYSQVKLLKTSHEGDTHEKRVRLQNLYCTFQDARMMEDESIRSYVGRISEIVAGITSHDGKKSDDEVIWKILKIMTPPFKTVTQMIQLMIPCTKNFTK